MKYFVSLLSFLFFNHVMGQPTSPRKKHTKSPLSTAQQEKLIKSHRGFAFKERAMNNLLAEQNKRISCHQCINEEIIALTQDYQFLKRNPTALSELELGGLDRYTAFCKIQDYIKNNPLESDK